MTADLPDLQTTEAGRQYEKSVMMVLNGEKRDYPSYFGGLKIASGNEFKVVSPIDSSIVFGIFQEPEEGIMVEAVTAAVAAAKTWSEVPMEKRAEYFRMPLETIKARRMFYAASVTVSTGMAREDALAEVDALIGILSKAIEDGTSGMRSGKSGVWAVLSAHNSPLASPVGFAAAAMIAGNSVVMCPSKYCPMPVYQFYSLMEKAGLPAGVLNLIVDRKDSSTEQLANDMRVAGVVATGSGERLEDLMFLQVDDELMFVNEIKGMNPALVYRPSDMKAAARDIAESAFAYSGQRLYSCSKVIVTADEQGRFMSALTEAVKDLAVGDPVNDTSFTGPIISEAALKEYSGLLAENAEFLVVKSSPRSDAPDGPYAPLAVVTGLDEENDLGFMDSGFPILDVKVVENLDRALEELEDTECGLSAGIFSKDAKAIERFKASADVQRYYINESSRSLLPGFEARVDRFA